MLIINRSKLYYTAPIRVECMFLSKTTLFYLTLRAYLHLMNKLELHVSALDNSHLQVLHESLECSYDCIIQHLVSSHR